MNHLRIFYISLLFVLSLLMPANGQSIFNPPNKQVFTLDSLGACQGVCIVEGNLFLYGDRSRTGVIRQYQYTGNTMEYLGGECQLTLNGNDIINHPTGIAYFNGDAFIGNSIRNPENPEKWIAAIYRVAWDNLLQYKTLDRSLLNTINDDLAIQGTRPALIEYKGKRYVATSDYGDNGNEVRLYHFEALKNASKTSDKDVFYAKFTCGPWVQNLHWIPQNNTLVLIQNQIEGRQWRLTFVDLEKSLSEGKEAIIKVLDFENQDELEGFCLLTAQKGIAVSSSRNNNVLIFDMP
jgi:hypothetical protein